MGVILAPVSSLILWLIDGLVSHASVLLVGGKGGWKKTFKVLAYVSTTSMVGPVPIVGILAWLYSFYLRFVGYKTQHNLTGGKAAIAVLIPIVVVIGLGLILAFVTGVAILTAIGVIAGSMGPPVGIDGLNGIL
jgi:hypothetical protein